MLALYIFMLAAFTGYEVISRVPVILHTPLMSGSNFVHGVVLVGGMIALGQAETPSSRPSALSPCCSARPTRPAVTW
jgi:NAD/NADP transhydrogenase alpha subunit